MVNQYSSEDNKAIKIPSPPSAVSLAGDSREPMANHYSSEYNKAIKIPSPPSALSLGGDSREPMVNQYSSEDNKAIKTPRPPSAVSPAGDTARHRYMAQCTGFFERRPLPYIYFTSTKPPFDFCSYNTQVDRKFSLKFQSQGLQRDSRSALGPVSGGGLPRTDTEHDHVLPVEWYPIQRDSGHPSAVSPAGYIQEPMIEQCSS